MTYSQANNANEATNIIIRRKQNETRNIEQKLLLVFSVTPYQNKNKNRSIDKVQNLSWEKKEGKYADSRQDSGESNFS